MLLNSDYATAVINYEPEPNIMIMNTIHSDNPDKTNDSFLRKLKLMTIVVLLVYFILGIVGFFLWFAFPVEKINGLTYLKGNSLIYYYLIVNFIDIAGIMFVSHMVYYKYINTSAPIRDGVFLGLYLLIASWLIDLFVYVFIRKTLPSIHEYFLGKNQPEIGIAWFIAVKSAIASGWMHTENRNLVRRLNYRKFIMILVFITIVSTALTIIGIKFFDIRP